MNALHPVMAQALRPFAPKDDGAVSRLYKIIEERDAAWNSLLRLPFEVEVEVHPATHLSEAQYEPVCIDEDLVREAADWLIDKHIGEMEAKALELQRARWDEQREDRE